MYFWFVSARLALRLNRFLTIKFIEEAFNKEKGLYSLVTVKFHKVTLTALTAAQVPSVCRAGSPAECVSNVY